MPMSPCPACGAPLEYTGDGETVRCHFCGTEFKVTEEDARPRFAVQSMPGPQKEVLQEGVSQVANPVDEASPASPGEQARIYPAEPDMYQEAFQSGLNPSETAPDFTAHTGEASRWSGIETPASPEPPPPASRSSFGSEILRRPGTAGRWIAIAVGVILLLCLACVCAAGLFFMARNGGTFQ